MVGHDLEGLFCASILIFFSIILLQTNSIFQGFFQTPRNNLGCIDSLQTLLELVVNRFGIQEVLSSDVLDTVRKLRGTFRCVTIQVWASHIELGVTERPSCQAYSSLDLVGPFLGNLIVLDQTFSIRLHRLCPSDIPGPEFGYGIEGLEFSWPLENPLNQEIPIKSIVLA